MNAQEQDAVLRMLQDDIAGEHASIMQYVQHAWRMGDAGGDIPCEVQEIARDEMRHFRWLAELVVDLGSDPTIERDIIYVNGSPPAELMRLDIDAEDRAIAQYVEHERQIDDRRIKRLINRVLVDERVHREKFRGYTTTLGGDPNAPTPRPGVGPFSGQRATAAGAQQQAAARPEAVGPFGAGDPHLNNEVVYVEPSHAPRNLQLPPGHDALVAALNSDVGKEYTTVLQYLFQSFVHKNDRLGSELQTDLAQWHMKHLDWLGDRISELGGDVTLDHGDINRTRDAAYVIQSDIQRQRDLADHYAAEQQTIGDDEARALLARMEAHDRFQVEQLEDLLEEVEAASGSAPPFLAAPQAPPEPPAPAAPRFTVGSLFGRNQDE